MCPTSSFVQVWWDRYVMGLFCDWTGRGSRLHWRVLSSNKYVPWGQLMTLAALQWTMYCVSWDCAYWLLTDCHYCKAICWWETSHLIYPTLCEYCQHLCLLYWQRCVCTAYDVIQYKYLHNKWVGGHGHLPTMCCLHTNMFSPHLHMFTHTHTRTHTYLPVIYTHTHTHTTYLSTFRTTHMLYLHATHQDICSALSTPTFTSVGLSLSPNWWVPPVNGGSGCRYIYHYPT